MKLGFGRRARLRQFATEERGGAALELALVLGVMAAFVFTTRQLVFMPVANMLTRTVQTISQALD